jgi:hypothetical protein
MMLILNGSMRPFGLHNKIGTDSKHVESYGYLASEKAQELINYSTVHVYQ